MIFGAMKINVANDFSLITDVSCGLCRIITGASARPTAALKQYGCCLSTDFHNSVKTWHFALCLSVHFKDKLNEIFVLWRSTGLHHSSSAYHFLLNSSLPVGQLLFKPHDLLIKLLSSSESLSVRAPIFIALVRGSQKKHRSDFDMSLTHYKFFQVLAGWSRIYHMYHRLSALNHILTSTSAVG